MGAEMIGSGEYRIEYYGADGAVVATDTAISMGDGKEKAERDCQKPGIAASGLAVVRCVLSSLDGRNG
jgi:hypothetical protein